MNVTALYGKLNSVRLLSHILCAAIVLSVSSPVSTQPRTAPAGNTVQTRLATHWNEAGPNKPPEIKIIAPLNNSAVGFGGLSILTFEASVTDAEDGANCCKVVWTSSSPHGVMGGGKTITYTFGTPGSRTITAKATDSGGLSGTSQIVVHTLPNSPPGMTIVKPTANQILYKGYTYLFEGTSIDVNEPFLKVPCLSMVWTSNKAGDPPPIAGCTMTANFPTTGSREITLTGTDSDGGSGSAKVTINVVDAPANSAPVVTILNPQNNHLLDPYTFHTLKAIASDPDGKTPLSYKWVLTDYSAMDLATGTVGNGNMINVSWKPSTNVSFRCGGKSVKLSLHVTDPDGKTGVATVEFNVNYPPC